jgi:hypothetical protein
MDRRSFLRSAGVAGAVVTAGCLTSSDADPSATDAGGDQSAASESPSPTEPPTETSSPTSASPVALLDHELIHEGEGEDAQVRVEATAQNESDQELGQVVATATFIEDDTLLGSWIVTANGMAPGQRWRFSIHSGGTSGEDAQVVDDVRVELEERTPPSDLQSSRVEFVEDELVHDGPRPAVEGEAKNVGEERLEYLEVVGMFSDEDDMLLGTALVDVVRDVDPDQQFRFSIGYSSPVQPSDAVAGYQLTADARVE